MSMLVSPESGWDAWNACAATLVTTKDSDALKIVVRAMLPRLVSNASAMWHTSGYRVADVAPWATFPDYVEEWLIQAHVWAPRVAQRRFVAESPEFFARALMIDVKRQITRQTDRAAARPEHTDIASLTDLTSARLCSPPASADFDQSLRRCGDLARWLIDRTGIDNHQANLLVASRTLGIPLSQLAGTDARRVGRQRARNEHKLRDALTPELLAL